MRCKTRGGMSSSVEDSLDGREKLVLGLISGCIDINKYFLGRGDNFLVVSLYDDVHLWMIRQSLYAPHAT